MTKLSFAGPRPTPTPAPPLQLFKQPVQLTFTQVEGRPTKKGLRRYLQWQIRLSSLFRLHCSRKSGEVPQHPPFPVVVKERVLYFGSIESKQWFPSTKPSSCLGAGGHSGSLQRALCVSGSPLIPSSSYHTHPEYTLPNPLRNVFLQSHLLPSRNAHCREHGSLYELNGQNIYSKAGSLDQSILVDNLTL